MRNQLQQTSANAQPKHTGSVTVANVAVAPTAEVPRAVRNNIRRLVGDAFAGRFSNDDWHHALGGWHVLIRDAGELVAHAAVVPRDIWVGRQRFACGYVEAVAAHPHRQGQRLGSVALRHVDQILRRSFQLGALSTSRHGFYQRLGWERWSGPTFVRTQDELRRTPDEDAGVMVLRFGPTAAVDLSDSITCVDRPGDAW